MNNRIIEGWKRPLRSSPTINLAVTRPPLTHIPELPISEDLNPSQKGTPPLPWAACPEHQITICPKNPTKPKPQNTEVAWSKAVVIPPFSTKKHTQIPGKHKGGWENSFQFEGPGSTALGTANGWTQFPRSFPTQMIL